MDELEDWFELVDDMPVLSPACRNIEFLKKIYTRDNGFVTSRNGKSTRVKEVATKEIAYIYFTISKKHYQGYKGKQRDDKIKERLGLPKTWQPDELIEEAIGYFKEDTSNTQRRLLDTLESNLETQLSLFKEVETHTVKVLTFLQEDIRELDQEKLAERNILIEKAKSDFNGILTFITSLDTAFAKIKKLRTELAQDNRKMGKEVSELETNRNLYRRQTA